MWENYAPTMSCSSHVITVTSSVNINSLNLYFSSGVSPVALANTMPTLLLSYIQLAFILPLPRFKQNPDTNLSTAPH